MSAMSQLLRGAGRAGRRAFEAWHGSPVRGIEAFDDATIRPNQMAGHGHYVAGNDRFGAGRALAESYKGDGDTFSVSGVPYHMSEILGGYSSRPPLTLPEAMSPEDIPSVRLAADAFRDASFKLNVPMKDTGDLRESVLDALSRTAESANNPFPAMRAANLVENRVVRPNTGALYRLLVDADRPTFIDFDKSLNDQPKFVQDLIEKEDLLDIIADRTPGDYFDRQRLMSLKDGGDILTSLEDVFGGPAEARDYLKQMGVQGVKASAGAFTTASGPKAMAKQYTIFDPERIKILEMLAAAGVVGAAEALARLQAQQNPQRGEA